MKYKVGDKVKIKTWGQMEREFGVYSFLEHETNGLNTYPSNFTTGPIFSREMENALNKRFPDRVLIVKTKKERSPKVSYYSMDGIRYSWTDEMIKCLAKEPTFIPITSRWELLDL